MKKTNAKSVQNDFTYPVGDPPLVVPQNVLKLAEEICRRRRPRLYFRSLIASKDSVKDI